MIFVERSEQRSFPEYVDMEFKDLVVRDEYIEMKGCPVENWRELLDLLKDGYFPEFCDIPDSIPDGEYIAGLCDGKWVRFAKNVFNKYGESGKAKRTCKTLEDDLDKLSIDMGDLTEDQCINLELPF